MTAQSTSDSYERALTLAEGGRHAEALELIKEHLSSHPRDVQAWNDAGAILYCMGRLEESIEHFEKAVALSGQNASAEIYWNLCEAYLDKDYPTAAAKLFDNMERLEVLSPDLINRTANSFLRQDAYGNAIEMLLRSLKMIPNQEVLLPMIEILRNNRPPITICAERESTAVRRIHEFISERFKAELCIAKEYGQIAEVLNEKGICWFEGCGAAAVAASHNPKECRIVIRIGPGQIYDSVLEQVNWDNVDALVLTGNSVETQDMLDRFDGAAGIASKTQIVSVAPWSELGEMRFVERNRGKNIAYFGDIDAGANPMLMLQCMQKLNYIDPDYRLYIGGTFADGGLEQHLKYMVDKLKLSGVVFFDGPVTNLSRWMQDKHHFVWTGTNSAGIENVLAAMACGLKPAVADFAGVEEHIDGEFVFDIAEHFCEQICSKAYKPQRYHTMVLARCSTKKQTGLLNDVLYRLERELAKSFFAESTLETFDTPGTPQMPMLTTDYMPSQTESFRPMTIVEPPIGPAGTIPIRPISSEIFTEQSNSEGDNISFATSSDKMSRIDPSKSYADLGKSGITDRLAREAMEASRVLGDLAKRDTKQGGFNFDSPPVGQGSMGLPPVGQGNASLPTGGYTSLDELSREQNISRVAAEFAGPGPSLVNRKDNAGVQQVPFTGQT